MTKNLLFISVILLLISCINNTKNKEIIVVDPVAKTLTLDFASKNPATTKNKTGKHVGVDEMLHLTLANNNQTEFVGKMLTLNNSKEGALNFYIRNDSVFCHTPHSLILMSMPPKPGVRPIMIDLNTNFYVAPMSLLKFESANIMFVGLVN